MRVGLWSDPIWFTMQDARDASYCLFIRCVYRPLSPCTVSHSLSTLRCSCYSLVRLPLDRGSSFLQSYSFTDRLITSVLFTSLAKSLGLAMFVEIHFAHVACLLREDIVPLWSYQIALSERRRSCFASSARPRRSLLTRLALPNRRSSTCHHIPIATLRQSRSISTRLQYITPSR
jgi:hypothetical protein